jgi:hypothetical protein
MIRRLLRAVCVLALVAAAGLAASPLTASPQATAW